MDDRLALVFLLLVAGLLFLSSWPLFPQAGVPSYTQSVEAVSEDAVPSEATVPDYRSLSEAGQRVIDAGSTADDSVTLHGEGPTEFVYTDAKGVNRGIHYVQQGATYYRIETYPGGLDVELIVQTMFRLVTVVIVFTGVGLSYFDSPPAVTVGLGVSALSLLGLPLYEQFLGPSVGRSSWLALLCAVLLLCLGSPLYGMWLSKGDTSPEP